MPVVPHWLPALPSLWALLSSRLLCRLSPHIQGRALAQKLASFQSLVHLCLFHWPWVCLAGKDCAGSVHAGLVGAALGRGIFPLAFGTSTLQSLRKHIKLIGCQNQEHKLVLIQSYFIT